MAQHSTANRHRVRQRLCCLLALFSALVQWCAPCEDLSSQDGAPWKTVDGYSCVNYDLQVYDCANYGSDVDQYDLTAKQACCLCGGGTTTVAPTQVGDTYAPTQVGDTYAPTTAPTAQFLWVANGGHDTSTCGTTSDDPCQTIAYGLNRFPRASQMTYNAILHVAAGTYGVPLDGITFEGRPVSIVGENGAVVDCKGYPTHLWQSAASRAQR